MPSYQSLRQENESESMEISFEEEAEQGDGMQNERSKVQRGWEEENCNADGSGDDTLDPTSSPDAGMITSGSISSGGSSSSSSSGWEAISYKIE